MLFLSNLHIQGVRRHGRGYPVWHAVLLAAAFWSAAFRDGAASSGEFHALFFRFTKNAVLIMAFKLFDRNSSHANCVTFSSSP